MIRTWFHFRRQRRRGREGSYPPSPRTNPGVRNYRTGLFRDTRFRNDSLFYYPLLVSRREVSTVYSARHVRVVFPLRVAYPCQLLPHVNGVTVSEYYELIRPPMVIGFPTCCFGSAYLLPLLRMNYPSKQLSQEPIGAPKPALGPLISDRCDGQLLPGLNMGHQSCQVFRSTPLSTKNVIRLLKYRALC